MELGIQSCVWHMARGFNGVLNVVRGWCIDLGFGK